MDNTIKKENELDPVKAVQYVRGIGTNGNSVNITVADVIELSTTKNKGIFTSVSSLETTVPSPNVGDWAGVGTVFPVKLYVCNTAGTWVDSGSTWSGGDINLSDYVTNTTANEIINSLSKKLDSSKIVVLSEDEYNALTTVQEGEIYFIYS